jgi:3-phosphoshikimate 1-carboxyvinyltransferase
MSDRLEIVPLTKPPRATVRVPGSKSITNRALVLAALANAGDGCTLRGALRSEDTEVMIACLRRLGFQIKEDWDNSKLWIGHFSPRRIPANNAELFVGNSGTTMRFLTAMVSLGQGQYRLDGIPRMRERPIEDLLVALRQLGVDARSELGNGCPPVLVQADGLDGGHVPIRGDTSSQFLSALMMVAPFARGPVYLKLAGSLVSEPYVEMTGRMLTEWGAVIKQPLADVFHIEPGLQREVQRYAIEPDASAASYFLAAAALASGAVCVAGLDRESLQGDVRFIEVLEQMGCRWIPSAVGLDLEGGPLRGIDVDMNDISDTVMTLAAVACFAEGPTTIRNVAHIRHKETDRLAALATELRRVGAEVTEFADGLTITPRPLHGAEIETYNDHRMAMSMALIGLRVPGIVIKNPGCVAKTYPHFFTDLERLREGPREDQS